MGGLFSRSSAGVWVSITGRVAKGHQRVGGQKTVGDSHHLPGSGGFEAESLQVQVLGFTGLRFYGSEKT